jgi:CRP-like cAMP-binding protein
MKRETVILLARHPLFRKLSQAEKAQLFKRMREEVVGANVLIFQQDTQGDSLYVLIEGEVIITREIEGNIIPLFTVKPGESFGELALLYPGTRLVTARTSAPSTYIRLTHDSFNEFSEANPQAGIEVRQLIVKQFLMKVRALEPLWKHLLKVAAEELNL